MISYADYLILAGVPGKKVDACMEWAFGPRWQTKELGDCMEYWNKHHSVCKITKETIIKDSLYKIGQLFMQYEEIQTRKN